MARFYLLLFGSGGIRLFSFTEIIILIRRFQKVMNRNGISDAMNEKIIDEDELIEKISLLDEGNDVDLETELESIFQEGTFEEEALQ